MEDKSKSISLYGAIMLLVATIASPIGMQSMSVYGSNMFVYYGIAALLFFVPSGIITIYLTKNSDSSSGLFSWVDTSLGRRTAIAAIWMNWLSVTVFFPNILTFLASLTSYTYFPGLMHNNTLLLIFVLCALWLSVIVNLFGIRISMFACILGGFFSSIVPACLVFVCSLFLGDISNINNAPILQDRWSDNISIFISIIIAFTGIEFSSYFFKNLNRESDYIKSIYLAIIIIVTVCVAGSYGISLIVSKESVDIVHAFMQSFAVIASHTQIPAFLHLINVAFILGFVCAFSTLLFTTSKSLLVLSYYNHLPFANTNKHGAPYKILIFQGIICSALSLGYLLFENAQELFWLLNVLTVLLVCGKYIIMFFAAYNLAKAKKNTRLTIYASQIGILTCSVVVLISFFPPTKSMLSISSMLFNFIVIGVLFALLSIPLLSNIYKKENNSAIVNNS